MTWYTARLFGIAGLLPTAIIIVSCAPQTCDPSTAGFVGGIVGQVSGCFRARQDVLEHGLVAVRTQALEEQANAETAAQAQSSALQSLEWRRQQLAILESRSAALKAAIARAEAANVKDRDLLRQAKDTLAMLRDRTRAPGTGTGAALLPLPDIDRLIRRLQDETAAAQGRVAPGM